jgi:DNA-binding transcriptional regulator YiaG
MTGSEFQAALRELGLTPSSLARDLGVARETVSRWAHGQLEVPQYAAYVLALLRAAKG